MKVHTRGTALRGIPPPSSEILIVMSSFPSATMTLTVGKLSQSTPCLSTTALSEFLRISNIMWFCHSISRRDERRGNAPNDSAHT